MVAQSHGFLHWRSCPIYSTILFYRLETNAIICFRSTEVKFLRENIESVNLRTEVQYNFGQTDKSALVLRFKFFTLNLLTWPCMHFFFRISKFPEHNLQLMVGPGAKGSKDNSMQISCWVRSSSISSIRRQPHYR